MSYYMGCKLVKAVPALKTDMGNIYVYGKDDRQINIVKNTTESIQCVEGYEVEYQDGYRSFSPKDVFDKAYLKVDDNPKLPSGVSIGPEMVRSFIKSYEVIERDDKTTIVYATLLNGFTVVESSSCVDPTNYSVEIGKEVCLRRIENKIWELLGFMLQSAYQGFN